MRFRNLTLAIVSILLVRLVTPALLDKKVPAP